jgi:hypothetical protein
MNISSDIAVVTAIIGGSDYPQPQVEQDIPVDYVLFTDDPELEAPGWNVFDVTRKHESPALEARRYKLLPPIPHKKVFWIDGNMSIIGSWVVREAFGCLDNGLAVFSHPWRRCIYDECEAGLHGRHATGKYDHEPIREQVAHYRELGHPRGWGLYASGTIAWDFNDARALQLAEAWWEECQRWSLFCQLSLPFVCRQLGIRPGFFPIPQIEPFEPHWGNRWIRIGGHAGD